MKYHLTPPRGLRKSRLLLPPLSWTHQSPLQLMFLILPIPALPTPQIRFPKSVWTSICRGRRRVWGCRRRRTGSQIPVCWEEDRVFFRTWFGEWALVTGWYHVFGLFFFVGDMRVRLSAVNVRVQWFAVVLRVLVMSRVVQYNKYEMYKIFA